MRSPLKQSSVVLVGLFFCLRTVPCLAAVKTDVVELLNGDRITCEIKKLDRGKLTVKTDGIGTISIEWNDIARVASGAIYDVELNSGERYFGTLVRGDSQTLLVVTSLGAQRLIMDTVVRINPLGGNLWKRLDGSISAGFNFTQANVQTQWTFNSTVSYRGRQWLTSLTGESSLTTNEDTPRQTRNQLTISGERFLVRRWSALAFSQLQQNEELSLNLRAVLGGGIQRILKQSNNALVTAAGGAAFTREQYSGGEDQSVAEGVAGLRWEFFTFDGRSTNLSVGVLTFYALSGEARVRLELNASFKSDIVGDLYWSVNTFESYNGAPPAGQKKNDAGVSAAVGWSF